MIQSIFGTLLASSLLCVSASAGTLRVAHPERSGEVLLQTERAAAEGSTALEFTTALLQEKGIAFRQVGTYLVSIAGYEPKVDSFDGWCYALNGVVPNVPADEVILPVDASFLVEWFWGTPT